MQIIGADDSFSKAVVMNFGLEIEKIFLKVLRSLIAAAEDVQSKTEVRVEHVKSQKNKIKRLIKCRCN